MTFSTTGTRQPAIFRQSKTGRAKNSMSL